MSTPTSHKHNARQWDLAIRPMRMKSKPTPKDESCSLHIQSLNVTLYASSMEACEEMMLRLLKNMPKSTKSNKPA
jgi:hypothetical protein